MKYTYSDEEDVGSDALSARRSNRQSGVSTPGEPNGPRFTASGRQVRSRHGGPYGESMLGGGMDSEEKLSNGALDGAVEDETGPTSHGRPQRGAQNSRVKSKIESGKHHGEDDSLDSMDEESDVTSSGGEWEGGDDEEPDDPMEDDDDDGDIEMSNGNEADEEDLRQSLVISLRYKKSDSSPPTKSVPGDRGLSKNISIPSAMSSDPGMIRPPHIAHVTTNQTEPNVGENSDDQWQDTQNAGPRVPAYDAASQNTPSEPKHVFSQEAATRGHTVGHTTESLPQHEPIIERIAKT